ncbi:MAG: dUTP pyrophosphatase [Allobaculum sp.]
MKLYWAKIKEDAIIPSRRIEDAGYDLYPCFEEDALEILPQHTVIVPTGIASAFDPEYVMIIKERGSTGIRGMSVRAGVMDSGYRGEYLIPITNVNDKPLKIIKKAALEKLSEEEKAQFIAYPYEKACAQGVLLRMPQLEQEEISYEELKAISSLRGEGRLGSSNK